MSDKRDDLLNEEDAIQQSQRKRAVVTLRNKVYIFVLGLLLFIFWPTFLSPIEKVRGEGAFKMSIMDPINSMFHNRGEGGILSEVEEIDTQLDELNTEIERVKIQKEVIKNLQDPAKQNTIINCLNFGDCSSIDEPLMKQLDLLRVFIIVDNLQSEKFEFDQKIILRNLNEYITENGKLAEIRSIRFGDPELENEDYQLYKVSIDMTLEFSSQTKQKLLSILDNIENKVYDKLKVMYVVERMNYSIPEYNEPQTIAVGLSAYYFVGGPEEDVPSAE